MTPVLEPPRSLLAAAPDRLRDAASIVRDAAESLAFDSPIPRESARFRMAADRLTRALGQRGITHARLLRSSPALYEQSGRYRTLIEMIDVEPNDEDERLRLALLLIRALVWLPETLPYPAD